MHRIAILGMVLLSTAAAAQTSTYTDLRRCPVVAGQGTDIVSRAGRGRGS
jgi:hypothetical protein